MLRQMLIRLEGRRRPALAAAAFLVVAIAALDWRFDVDISFGFLYLFPMLVAGRWLNRWQIAAAAAVCTALSEFFDPFLWTPALGISRLIVSLAAFFGAGLYVCETTKSRRLAEQHVEEIEREILLRRDAEQQLRFLIESSPASILTLDTGGCVLMANNAAHRLLGFEPGSMEGGSVAQYLPALASVPPLTDFAPGFRTVMECRGRRLDGEAFLAQILFSTYSTHAGPRLAAVVFDTSEDLRNREELTLQQLLTGSRIVVSAVCHEMRNVCGAIASVHANLVRNAVVAQSDDFRALGSLVDALGRIASFELGQTVQPQAEEAGVASVLEELRIVVEPSLRESGISATWDIPPDLPPVMVDRQFLLQAGLNLIKNSERAMAGVNPKELLVRACVHDDTVRIQIMDSGGGVQHPEQLFKPFQHEAEASGLGLYLSRAFLRRFNGDVQYEPQPTGCCFTIVLDVARASGQEMPTRDYVENPVVAGR